MRKLLRALQRLRADTGGSISILAAFVLVGMVGVSALALEYGHGLLQRTENQRVADLAAYAGALVYNSTSSSSDAASAANNIAALNGLSGDATPSVVSSPTGDGNNAMQVTVTSNVPLLLARVLTTSTTLPVSATAYAEIKSDAPGCIIALNSGGTGIALTGGATVTADSCAVVSNAAVTAHACSNTITTTTVDYNSSTAPPSCSLVAAPGKSSVQVNKVSTADPLSGNSEVSTAKARFNSPFPPIATPSAPTVPTGTSVSFAYSTATLPAGCTDSFSSSTHTVTCTGTGPFNFGSLSIGGGLTVIVNNSSSGATYNFSGTISSGSSNGMTFNGGSNATYNMAAGISGSGNAPMSFTAGKFNFGTTTCSGKTNYSICVSGSARITFAGPSTFALSGGIYQNASGMPSTPALSLGYGTTTNSFNIGKGSDGNSLNESNGATLFGDATGSSDLFQMAGNLTTSGGTCVAVSAAAEHDINGYIAGAGGLYLGSGIYTVNGYVALGNSSGGNVGNCPTSGTTTGLSALGVTLVISGASTVTCGSTTSAFCLGAGYSSVILTAPTSSSALGSSTAGLAVIGPQSSSNTGAATFTSGATSTQISGAFYFPNGQVYMSGGATLHDTVDTSACLELIGTQITLTAGGAVGTTCTGLGNGSSGATVALVQ
jgi:Putative Flp pilus-assembly TadE/G-like